MNAYELADSIEDWDSDGQWDTPAANMLRQQADRIAELEKFFKPAESQLEYENRELQRRIVILEKDLHMLQRHYDQLNHDTTPQTKPLSDEEINQIIKQQDWFSMTWVDMVRRIERIIKEKNEPTNR